MTARAMLNDASAAAATTAAATTAAAAAAGRYVHYNHTDACRLSRWNARESYQFMYERSWQKVADFYSNLVKGNISFTDVFTTQRHIVHDDADILEPSAETESLSCPTRKKAGRWARVTFKIVLSYNGGSFDGWQKQPGLDTVQGSVERALGKFIDEDKLLFLKDKGLPIEGCAVVAGRTDKGVTAFQQVCSFYTWRKDVKAQDIEGAINDAAPGKLRVISVSEVSRAFHPNFSANWRRYLYIFPFTGNNEESSQSDNGENAHNYVADGGQRNEVVDLHIAVEDSELLHDNDNLDTGFMCKPTRFSVKKVDQLLRQLEGKLLSYKMFARDTKPSRNTGPPTECFVFHARATETKLPTDAKWKPTLCPKWLLLSGEGKIVSESGTQDEEGTQAMFVELVANRFLRKMVRVLVATAIREAAAGSGDDALLKLMDATCRRATAPPAPPDGLSLVDVGYTEFDPKACFIL